jgi:hypothetical protein
VDIVDIVDIIKYLVYNGKCENKIQSMTEKNNFFDTRKGLIAATSLLIGLSAGYGSRLIADAYGDQIVADRIANDLNYLDSPFNYDIEELIFAMILTSFFCVTLAAERGATKAKEVLGIN